MNVTDYDEIKTLQQETGYRDYLKQRKKDARNGIDTLPFSEWYVFWCFENGLFYDY